MSCIVIRTRMRKNFEPNSCLLAESLCYRAIPGLHRAGESSYRLVGPVPPRIIMVTDGVVIEETMGFDEKD